MDTTRAAEIKHRLGRWGWMAACQLVDVESKGMDPLADGWGECEQARRAWREYGAGHGVEPREAMEAVRALPATTRGAPTESVAKRAERHRARVLASGARRAR